MDKVQFLYLGIEVEKKKIKSLDELKNFERLGRFQRGAA